MAVSKDGPQYRFVIPATKVLFNCVEDGSGVFLPGRDVFGKTGFHPRQVRGRLFPDHAFEFWKLQPHPATPLGVRLSLRAAAGLPRT